MAKTVLIVEDNDLNMKLFHDLLEAHGYATIQKNATFILMELALRSGREEDFDRWFARLQELLPDVKLSKDFFRIFDISDVINMKEF